MLDVVADEAKKKKKNKVHKQIDSYSHCQSLQKMQGLTQQRNEEIKRLIYQNAELSRRNAQLKEMSGNPTFREHQLQINMQAMQAKINQLEKQISEKDEKYRIGLLKIRSEYEDKIRQRERDYVQGFRSQQAGEGQIYSLGNRYSLNKDRTNQNTFEIVRQDKHQTDYNNSKLREEDYNSKAYASPVRVASNSNSKKDQIYTFGAPTYVSYPETKTSYNPPFSKYQTQRINLNHPVQNKIIKPDYYQHNPSRIYVYGRESSYRPQQIHPKATEKLQKYKIPTEIRQNYTSNDLKIDVSPSNSNGKILKVVSKGTGQNLQTVNYHSVYGKKDMDQIYKRYCISD